MVVRDSRIDKGAARIQYLQSLTSSLCLYEAVTALT